MLFLILSYALSNLLLQNCLKNLLLCTIGIYSLQAILVAIFSGGKRHDDSDIRGTYDG
jgi:hypothetical protein